MSYSSLLSFLQYIAIPLILCVLQCSTWLAWGLNSLDTKVALILYVHSVYATKVAFERHLEVLVSGTSLHCIGPQYTHVPKMFHDKNATYINVVGPCTNCHVSFKILESNLTCSKVHAPQHCVHCVLWSKASVIRMLLWCRRSPKRFINSKPNNYHRWDSPCLCT